MRFFAFVSLSLFYQLTYKKRRKELNCIEVNEMVYVEEYMSDLSMIKVKFYSFVKLQITKGL